MKFKNLVVIGLSLILVSCVNTGKYLEKGSNYVPSEDKAIVLLNVEEGYVFKAGKAFLIIRNDDNLVSFRSLAFSTGGVGYADRVRKGGIFSYLALEVPAGTYGLSHWVFRYRRGNSLEVPPHKEVTFKPGEIYYGGLFFANNVTHSARMVDNFEEDLPYFVEKYPFIKSREVKNVSNNWSFDCWPSNKTLEFYQWMLERTKSDKEDSIKVEIKRCFPGLDLDVALKK